MHFLKLIRTTNLIIIAATILVIRYLIIEPILMSNDILFNTNYVIWLYLLHAVGIAAAGNIINDYFDILIDKINKPDRVIVGKHISKQKASFYHQLITGVALAIGLWIAYAAQSLTIAIIMVSIPGLLWFYSSVYKRQILIGNIIIAFLTAMVPILLVLIVNRFLIMDYGDALIETQLPKVLFTVVSIYAGFAFITNLTREIVKDIEDEEGDREIECNTLPIAIGISWTKVIIILLSILTLVGLYFIYKTHLVDVESSILNHYIIWMIASPIIASIVLTVLAKEKMHFHRISNLHKLIMASGILFSLPYYFVLARTLSIPFFGLIIE